MDNCITYIYGLIIFDCTYCNRSQRELATLSTLQILLLADTYNSGTTLGFF
jgi:hypothetical protein